MLTATGWSKGDIRRAVQHHELHEIRAWEELMEESHKRREQSEKAAFSTTSCAW
jgi:hypothetical protein